MAVCGRFPPDAVQFGRPGFSAGGSASHVPKRLFVHKSSNVEYGAVTRYMWTANILNRKREL